MGKKSHHEFNTVDFVMTRFSIMGALLSLIAMLPFVPWRKAQANPHMGARFSMARSISLFTISDNTGKHKSWLKMRKDLCSAVQEINKPSIGGMLVGAVTHLVGAGNAAAGCASWKACKDHATARCTSYGVITGVGIGCVVMQLLAAVLGAGTCVFFSSEANVKKKKQKELEKAQNKTMTCGCAAGLFPVVSVGLWVGMTDMEFKSLQKTGYYPYPGCHAGPYLAGAGALLLFVAGVCSVHRVHPLFGDKGHDHHGDGAAEGDPDMTMTGQPSMMGPTMSMAPPGTMGQPGMMGPPGMMGGPPGGMMGGPPMGGPPAFMSGGPPQMAPGGMMPPGGGGGMPFA